MSNNDLFVQKGAKFSDCKTYRYALWRTWDTCYLSDKPYAMFLMLNPSTADESVNDPTVERCQRYAHSWDYGGLVVCNLFAFRATNPADMKAAADPVGPENDAIIIKYALDAGVVVCGWGNHGGFLSRSQAILSLLRQKDIVPYCLTTTKQNEPGHPLYLKKDLAPRPLPTDDNHQRGA